MARGSLTGSSGWYPDPENSNIERYWNGREWTKDTQPARGVSVGNWSGPQRTHHREVVLGWITAVLFPPIGAVVGIRLLKTEERTHGVWMIVVAGTILVLAAASALTDSSSAYSG